MSTLMRRRDEFTKIRIALNEIFLKSRKEHLIKKIINLLRDKSFNEIDAFESLFLFQRVNVLLSTFIVENQNFLALTKMNIKLNNFEWNTTKITFILFIYAIVTKIKSMQNVEFTIVIIAIYNNINQQRQLKKIKRERRMIFKIKKQKKKKKSESAVDKKADETFTKSWKNEKSWWNVYKELKKRKKMCWRRVVCRAKTWKWWQEQKKIKKRVIINEILVKNIVSSIYIMRRTFEILIHDVCIIDVQTINQQKTIRKIEKKNEALHSKLKIVKII